MLDGQLQPLQTISLPEYPAIFPTLKESTEMNQAQQPQHVQLHVTIKDIETILGVLGKQPFEQVADLFMNIRQQAMSQLNPPPAPSGPDAPMPPATPETSH
jgi:hypothetical protein